MFIHTFCLYMGGVERVKVSITSSLFISRKLCRILLCFGNKHDSQLYFAQSHSILGYLVGFAVYIMA